MDGNWLDNEFTFEDLELPPDLEMECIDRLTDDDNLPYMKELDPDAEYIKSVADGKYRHKMPGGSVLDKYDYDPDEGIVINMPGEKALLAGFANVMGWSGSDMSEEGYLKAVIQNKPGKAVIIKDLIEIENLKE